MRIKLKPYIVFLFFLIPLSLISACCGVWFLFIAAMLLVAEEFDHGGWLASLLALGCLSIAAISVWITSRIMKE